MKTEGRHISNQITEGVIWKQLLFFFFPILFGTFFQQLYNTTDAVIVGKFVGKEALAAVGGPAATLINLLIGFFTGLSSGATVILAQYYGAKKEEDVKKTVHTAVALSIAGGGGFEASALLFDFILFCKYYIGRSFFDGSSNGRGRCGGGDSAVAGRQRDDGAGDAATDGGLLPPVCP